MSQCLCQQHGKIICRWCFYYALYILSLSVLHYKMTFSDGAHAWLMEFMWINVNTQESLTNYLLSLRLLLGNSAISKVPHTKYLGVTIHQKLSWNENTHKESPAKLIKLIVLFSITTSTSVLLMSITVTRWWSNLLMNMWPLSGLLMALPTQTN